MTEEAVPQRAPAPLGEHVGHGMKQLDHTRPNERHAQQDAAPFVDDGLGPR
jgi:hypothetical protein